MTLHVDLFAIVATNLKECLRLHATSHTDTYTTSMPPTSRTIHSSSTHAIELLVNYGIGYWIPYILKHYEEWGLNNPLVKCVLWLLLSDNSFGQLQRHIPLQPKQKCLRGEEAPAGSCGITNHSVIQYPCH